MKEALILEGGRIVEKRVVPWRWIGPWEDNHTLIVPRMDYEGNSVYFLQACSSLCQMVILTICAFLYWCLGISVNFGDQTVLEAQYFPPFFH